MYVQRRCVVGPLSEPKALERSLSDMSEHERLTCVHNLLLAVTSRSHERTALRKAVQKRKRRKKASGGAPRSTIPPTNATSTATCRRNTVVYALRGVRMFRFGLCAVFQLGKNPMASLIVSIWTNDGAILFGDGCASNRFGKYGVQRMNLKGFLKRFGHDYGPANPTGPHVKNNLPSVVLPVGTMKLDMYRLYKQA